MSTLFERVVRRSLELRRGFRREHVATTHGAVHILHGPRAQGPTLVIVHGLSASGASYAPMMPHLVGRVGRIVLPDLPGHGFSDRPGALDAETVYGGLRDALDHTLDEPAIVVGNSLGGFVATRYALDRPERVRGLVLLSPAGTPSTQAEIDEVRRIFGVRTHQDALDFLDRLLIRPDPRLRHLFAFALRRRLADPLIHQLLHGVEVGFGLGPEELARLAPPTLFVWGAHDRILPERHREYYRAHLPGHARIETPDHFGHSPHLDSPRRTAARILDFVAEVSADARPAAAS
jgi:pimeloyl-ACP methyl ester carboxylesterase